MIFEKKCRDNIVEYCFLGKVIAKKVILPFGYRIRIRNKTIYKKIKIEKFVEQAGRQISRMDGQISRIDKKLDVLNSVQTLHQESFKPFKNSFHGRDIALLATGPTLKQYVPIEKMVHIGVNNAYKFKPVILDFLFIQDIQGLKGQMAEINAYGSGQCQKFYGDVLIYEHCIIPESDVIQAHAKRYYTAGMGSPFHHDIASCFLPDFGSVVFPALAFALYTNPKKLYLIGCDCSDIGYFDSDKSGVSPSLKQSMPEILKGWQEFKKFAEHFYPDTEIISINPVGLKGMFKDEYSAHVKEK